MKRLVAPSDQVRSVEIEGVRTGRKKTYGWSKDGTVHVESAADVKALKSAGFTVAGVGGASAKGGFECQSWGFHMWFRTCSRCGGEGNRL